MSTDYAIRIEGLSKRYYIAGAPEPVAARPFPHQGVGGRARAWLGHRRAGRGGSREFWALDDVSFDIPAGRKLGIMGRNGAGKSTLLKILSRVTEPTKGRVAIRGRVASLLEVGTGFNPELSGRENIFLNGAVLGMSQREIRRKFDEIVDFAEIDGFLDVPVKRYSSGMYVRLAFAVAAHLESEILIIDEVLAVGDAQFQRKCMGRIDEAATDGRTVIFVSHSSGTVARLCTHAVLLDRGKLVFEGTSQDGIRQYLGSQAGTETEFTLEPDSSKDLSLLKVEINPGSNQGTDVFYDDPIRFRLTYQVNRRASDCMVWAAVQTIEGQVVFCTADSDTNPSLLEYRQPGVYEAEFTFPPRWLNHGEYSIIVGLVRNNPVEVFQREEALTFKVDESGMPSAVTGTGVRGGVIQPEIPWSLSRLE